MTQSESKQNLAAQQTHVDLHPGQGVITMPTRDEIAVRAYYIYLQSGCAQGHCNQNWFKAEHELREDQRGRGVERDDSDTEDD